MRDKTVLKVARIRKGYTIEQLAPLVKLSKNTMNKYDKGYFRNGYFVRYIEDWLLDNNIEPLFSDNEELTFRFIFLLLIYSGKITFFIFIFAILDIE